MIGHIKLDRKILNWEWYTDHKVFHLFIHLLLKANHKDGKWKGIFIKRGQVIFGRLKASANTGLTENEIRTCLKKLKLTNEITIKSTNKYSIITICKYDTYQSSNENINQQNYQQHTDNLTNKSPTINQQLTTNKNDKNDKNDNTTATAEKKLIGIVVVKKVANEVWKDKIWMESLCMGNGLKMDEAKDWMSQFNLSISQDEIERFDNSRYKKMFAGWLRMKLGGGQKIVKMSDEKEKEKQYMKSIGL